MAKAFFKYLLNTSISHEIKSPFLLEKKIIEWKERILLFLKYAK